MDEHFELSGRTVPLDWKEFIRGKERTEKTDEYFAQQSIEDQLQMMVELARKNTHLPLQQ